MKSRQEVKAALKDWMVRSIIATDKKGVSGGFGSTYNFSDICFAFRSKFGIKMNERFVSKILEIEKRKPMR